MCCFSGCGVQVCNVALFRKPCESKENREQPHCGSFLLHRDRSKNTKSAVEGCGLNCT